MDDLLRIANRQILLYIDSQDRELPLELARVRRAAAEATSGGRSSRYILEVDLMCADFITKFGAAVWEILHRCITTGHVPYTPDLAVKLKEFSSPYLFDTVHGLTQVAAREAAARGMPMEPKASEAARDHARATLETEIDLFCAVLSRVSQTAPYQPPHVFNMYGSTVANLQTGNNSISTVTMHAPSGEFDSILSALEDLKRALQESDGGETPMFLVNESEAELRKPRPDPSKLRSLMDATKACVTGLLDTAPKVPAAIESVQRALAMLPMP